jgi:hypothetical protein
MASTRSAASGTDPVLRTTSVSWHRAVSRTAPRAALAERRLWFAVCSADISPIRAAARSSFKTPGVPSRYKRMILDAKSGLALLCSCRIPSSTVSSIGLSDTEPVEYIADFLCRANRPLGVAMEAQEAGTIAGVGRRGAGLFDASFLAFWAANEQIVWPYNPKMSYAACRCVPLNLHQPRPRFAGGCLNAVRAAFSAVDDLGRLTPAFPSRYLDRQQFPAPPFAPHRSTLILAGRGDRRTSPSAALVPRV